MKKILVGVDGSLESRNAASFAATLAEARKEKLVLVSAAYVEQAFGAPELSQRAAGWLAEERKQCDELVKEMASGLQRPGLEVEWKVANGPPAAVLADLAQDPEVDFIVVGHRGRSAFKRVLTGSVADRLVQISPRPVLVFR